MDVINIEKNTIELLGSCIIEKVYNDGEVDLLCAAIARTDYKSPSFRKSAGLFAIRRFLNEVPQALPIIFNKKLVEIIHRHFGSDYFVVKSIYFDKPEESNWFVAYHQDLTISVKEKIAIEGFGPWTTKSEQYAVQPPLNVLENNFTIRIHLDDTNEHNGALRVIPGSHKKGVYRAETIDWTIEKEVTCPVPAGGIMIMRPLLLHASGRTTNGMRRRVIHLEFSNVALPAPLQWAEIN